MSPEPTKGRVHLVGAGPGAVGLVTLRGWKLICRAEVLVYDHLCNPEMLRWVCPGTEIIYAGKTGSSHTLTQEAINALLVDRARAGKRVVRLKGGDPYIFGRGGEEALVLARAGINFQVVPGVTSAIAAPSYAGIPVTHREFASTVTFVTGHEDPTKENSAIDWNHLAQLRGTKIFLMGVERLREIALRLVAEGAAADTPVALVRWGTTARQETIEGTLATIAGLAAEKKFAAPAIVVVGEVVKLRGELNWYEKLPLFGQRIVVTRTRQQASHLTEKLQRLGADVLEIPTIHITPIPLGGVEREKLTAMSSYFDWLVFTSPNSVDIFFAEFFDCNSDIRRLGSVKLAAIGPATGSRLRHFHLKIDLEPKIYTSEKIAEAFLRHDLRDVRFCLPQGSLANPKLAEFLRKKGAQVDDWKLYDTQPESEDLTGARDRYIKEGAHWITFTSSSTAEYWHALQLQPSPAAPRPKVVSMGPVTSASLRDLKMEIAAEAPASTLDSLVETICRLSLELPHAEH